MNTVFFIFLTLFLIIIQTIVLPSFSWFAQCFDLLIIEILFLSFISSRHTMAFAIIIIGCIMDSISGVPFFFHIFSYLWIYIIVQMFKLLLFQKSTVFILIISIVSVLIQHGLLLFLVFVNQEDNTIWKFNFSLMIRQVFWGFIFIPPGIWLVNICYHNWIIATKFLQFKLLKNTENSIDRIH
ncbi:hypothetical protein [Desulfobacula sp.]